MSTEEGRGEQKSRSNLERPRRDANRRPPKGIIYLIPSYFASSLPSLLRVRACVRGWRRRRSVFPRSLSRIERVERKGEKKGEEGEKQKDWMVFLYQIEKVTLGLVRSPDAQS